MNPETHQKAIEIALRRRAGMSREQAARVRQRFEAQDDLFTTCPRCGLRVRGTMEQVLAHRCGA